MADGVVTSALLGGQERMIPYMNNPMIIWAIVCLATALVLFMIEIFVPSGGLIGVAAGAALIAGIVLLFRVNTTLGVIGATVVLLAVPVVMAWGIKVAPNTPVMRWLTLKPTGRPSADARSLERGEVQSETGAVDASLVGQEGQAVTELRPVGTCIINGRRRECLSDAGLIHAGARVRVVHADGMQIKVRVVEG